MDEGRHLVRVPSVPEDALAAFHNGQVVPAAVVLKDVILALFHRQLPLLFFDMLFVIVDAVQGAFPLAEAIIAYYMQYDNCEFVQS